MAPPRRTFQPVITASAWETAHLATAAAASQRRGQGRASDGLLWPKLTNGDVITLVKAWHDASPSGFPLWYQYAAAAYGWNARKRDKLDTSARQRDAAMDIEIVGDLEKNLLGVADDLDTDAKPNPRIELDANAFDDGVFQGRVRAELVQDGAKAQFKIPVGCKDPRTGKSKSPGLKCREGFTLERVPGTLVFVCKNKQTGETENPTLDCDPVFVDDPITGVKKQLIHELVGIGLILAVVLVIRSELGK